jgi:hypothetical protein
LEREQRQPGKNSKVDQDRGVTVCMTHHVFSTASDEKFQKFMGREGVEKDTVTRSKRQKITSHGRVHVLSSSNGPHYAIASREGSKYALYYIYKLSELFQN